MNMSQYCRIGETGTNVVPTFASIFELAKSNWNSVTTLSDTKAIVCYRDDGNSGYGTAQVLLNA